MFSARPVEDLEFVGVLFHDKCVKHPLCDARIRRGKKRKKLCQVFLRKLESIPIV